MGLKIIKNTVIVDHSIKEHLHTDKTGNPVENNLNDLLIHSIYKRLKNSAKQSRDRSAKRIGDNCPLIYALKKQQNLVTNFTSIKRLNEHFPDILSEITRKIDGHIDGIIVMPSQFQFANILASRISRQTGLPICDNVFRKSTNQEALQRAERLLGNSISSKESKIIRNTLKKMKQNLDWNYSAKTVPTKIRSHFDPVQFNALQWSKEHRFLLVDDLLATGQTFLAARNLLVAQGWQSPLQAVTWFSGV